MKSIAQAPAVQRRDLFNATAHQCAITPAAAEKDFWIVWVLQQLSEVVAFKQKFYPASWANYPAATPAGLQLLPAQSHRQTLEKDYIAMVEMIFGSVPSFTDIIQTLSTLEAQLHNLRPEK